LAESLPGDSAFCSAAIGAGSSRSRSGISRLPFLSLPKLARRAIPTFPQSEKNTRSLLSLMPTEQAIETEGVIVAVLAGTMFRVELGNKHKVLAHISGKMRKRFIRLTLGDKVKLEMSPYDLDKARITYRLR